MTETKQQKESLDKIRARRNAYQKKWRKNNLEHRREYERAYGKIRMIKGRKKKK